MEYGAREYRVTVAAEAPAEVRADFIRKTYLHLGGAVLLFAGLLAALVNAPFAEDLVVTMAGSKFGWLAVLAAFMFVGWVAERWARSATSVPMQYLGLGLYVVAEAFIFLPLLYVAAYYAKDPDLIPKAGIYTAVIFGGLTGIAFLTRKDFSFMRGVLQIAGFGALATIIVSILFGFSLGTLFSGAMVLLAGGYILYYTSNVIHHYPVGSHVAAALALFAAVALLFWHILRILMDRR